MRDRFKILVLDGQGGGLGAQLIKQLKPRIEANCELLCVGTNALATGAMLKAGAIQGASGENAVIYNAKHADLILGPIGIIKANGIMGEISPEMAIAVSAAEAIKILIPSSTCGIYIAGTENCRFDEYIQRAVDLAVEKIPHEA